VLVISAGGGARVLFPFVGPDAVTGRLPRHMGTLRERKPGHYFFFALTVPKIKILAGNPSDRQGTGPLPSNFDLVVDPRNFPWISLPVMWCDCALRRPESRFVPILHVTPSISSALKQPPGLVLSKNDFGSLKGFAAISGQLSNVDIVKNKGARGTLGSGQPGLGFVTTLPRRTVRSLVEMGAASKYHQS